MPLAAFATRLARRTLDLLLILLILVVIALLVLARGLPAATGGSTFVVGGPSMEPAIPFGAVVHVVPTDPASLRAGDVVSIRTGPERAVFTHRIVRFAELPDGPHIETKGDNNPDADPALVPVTSVIGRVELTVPYAGFGVALLSSGQGILFLISLAAVLLAAAWLLEAFEDDQRYAMRRRAAVLAGELAPDPGARSTA